MTPAPRYSMSRPAPYTRSQSSANVDSAGSLLVAQAPRLLEVDGDRLFHGAAVAGSTDRDLLECRTTVDHLAAGGDQEGVGDDPAGHHGLPSPRVLVHSVRAQQRTPSIAVAYAVRRGVPPLDAQRMVPEALPHSRRHGRLWEMAAEVAPDQGG
jgi:hypothetical protein